MYLLKMLTVEDIEKDKAEIMHYIEAKVLDNKVVTSRWLSWFCSMNLDSAMTLLMEYATRDGVARPDLDMLFVVMGAVANGESCVSIVLGDHLEVAKPEFKARTKEHLYCVCKKNLLKSLDSLFDQEYTLEIPTDSHIWPVSPFLKDYMQSEEVLHSLETDMMRFFIGQGPRTEDDVDGERARTVSSTTSSRTAPPERKRNAVMNFFKKPAKCARTETGVCPGLDEPEVGDKVGVPESQASEPGTTSSGQGKGESPSSTCSAAIVAQSHKATHEECSGLGGSKPTEVKKPLPKHTKSSKKKSAGHKKGNVGKVPTKKMKRIIKFSDSESESSSAEEDDMTTESIEDELPPVLTEDAEVASELSVSKGSQEIEDATTHTKMLTTETLDAEDGFLVTKKTFSLVNTQAASKPPTKAEDKRDDGDSSADKVAKLSSSNPKKGSFKMKQSSLTDFFKK